MVCVPCYLMPLLLILWKFLQPFISVLWTPKKPVEGSKSPSANGTKDDEGNREEQPAPSGCPVAASGPALSKKDD